MIRRCLLVFVITTLAACAPATRSPSTERVHIERRDASFELGPTIRRVVVDNPLGEINVRARDEREVGIHAVVQSRAAALATARFDARRDGDTLAITVRFADADAAGRIDVALYVPTDLALGLSTRDGRIAAKRRSGPIEAHTDSGDIQASSRDRLDLGSASGQIRAIAIGPRWQGESRIRTLTGRIVLLVPTFGDVDLEARTGGNLRSGFGLSVHATADGSRVAHARYGSGSSVLRASSVSGEIVLDQLVLLGQDKVLPEDDD